LISTSRRKAQAIESSGSKPGATLIELVAPAAFVSPGGAALVGLKEVRLERQERLHLSQ
jgi:hypothetical protein